ncbi:MAG: hypothetical protein K2X59_00040 [Sphingomonas sp.]|nr:hypothetical protein [Sphingomonas sp.]
MNRVSSLAILAMVGVPVGGCQKIEGWRKPEVAACRSFVSGGLRSPSTYSEIEARSERGKDGDGNPMATVTISYDAANAYGTPVRGAQICYFAISKDGKFSPEPSVATALASADRALGQNNGGSCCIPPTKEDPNDPAANITMADNLTMEDTAANITPPKVKR